MTHAELVEFMRRHTLCVVSTVASDGAPESAVVGFAVATDLRIVFDTVASSRKYRNLISNPRVSVAMWTGEKTVQYEGIASLAGDADRELYFETFPDGRERLKWQGITHFVVAPKWIRCSDFDARPPRIEEFAF
jgi:pyridoxine/pyridoxamine 5'-phosphate oxidase